MWISIWKLLSDRLRHGSRSRAYRDVFTACLENSFQIDTEQGIGDYEGIFRLSFV